MAKAKLGDQDRIAQRWAERTAAAVPDWTAAINRVDSSPMEKAVLKQAEYVAGVAREQEKWARKLRAVTLSDWKATTVKKGQTVIAERTKMAQSKFAKFMNLWLQYTTGVRQDIDSRLPRGTPEQNIARMVAFTRAAMDFKMI